MAEVFTSTLQIQMEAVSTLAQEGKLEAAMKLAPSVLQTMALVTDLKASGVLPEKLTSQTSGRDEQEKELPRGERIMALLGSTSSHTDPKIQVYLSHPTVSQRLADLINTLSVVVRVPIGEAVKISGIEESKIRYIHSLGVSASSRRESGYTEYTLDDLAVLLVMSDLINLGQFKIGDVAKYVKTVLGESNVNGSENSSK